MKELINAQDEYIKLITEELNELVGIASAHGWESSRVEKGAELRWEISRLKAKVIK